MTNGRFFRNVFLVTVCVDLFAGTILHAAPMDLQIHTPGRWVIGLVAGYAGARAIGLVRTLALTVAAIMLATLLSTLVFVLTGRAMAEGNGPVSVAAMLLLTFVIAIAGALAGAAGALLRQRLSRRPAD
jgi:hypothetical protein